MQAAIGCAQLDKLPHIIKARQENWQYLRDGLVDLADYLVLPEAETNSQPSWFGFLISVRTDAPFNREEIVAHLEKHNIQTRMLFAGNLLKHPCFDEMRATGDGYRVIGELVNTDFVMNNAFWIGVYPGMSVAKNDYMIEKIKEFVNAKKS